MKIFLDTANVSAIEKYAFMIDGVTTNPSNVAREQTNPTPLILKICSLLSAKEVSVEVTEKEPANILKQARQIGKLAPNVVIKIPCYQPYYSVIQQLVEEGFSVNVTLVFSVMQVFFMAKMGVKYVSPFIGRLDDAGENGIKFLEQALTLKRVYNFPTFILAASIRDIESLEKVVLLGADAVTVPVSLLEDAFKNRLTQKGMEKFDKDWQQLKKDTFPE